MVCARKTFFAVMGKNAPAFTVASFAMIMHSRPLTRPSPVTTPAPGAPPYSAYIPCAAHSPSSDELRSFIQQELQPLSRRQPAFAVLRFDRLRSASLANRILFGAHRRHQLEKGITIRS